MPHRRTLLLVPAAATLALAARFDKYRLVFTISGRKVSRIAGGRGAYALQQECV